MNNTFTFTFVPRYIGDAVPAMLVATVLFILPMELSTWNSDKGTA